MSTPTTVFTPITPAPPGSANEFRNIYAASLHPEVLTLMLSYGLNQNGASSEDSAMWQTLLRAAMATGEPLDQNIHIYGWDSYTTMAARAGYGYSWVPAVGQQAIYGSPFNPINAATFSGPVPSGAIKVSVNIADYPAYVLPTPPAPPESFPVGSYMFGNLYEAAKGDTHKIGDEVSGTWSGLVYGTEQSITGKWTKIYFGQPSPVGGAVAQVWEKV